MFHAMEENKLFDFINGKELTIDIYKGKTKYDILRFLNDVSIWMEKNKDIINDKYFPFSVLSVGASPIQVSSFLFGLFVGRAITKAKLDIKIEDKKLTEEETTEAMKNNMKYYRKLFGDFKTDKENDNDRKDSRE